MLDYYFLQSVYFQTLRYHCQVYTHIYVCISISLFLSLDYLDILLTPITSIINASPEQGKCPNFFRQAHVTPILKISSLDKEIFKNYRPIGLQSELPFKDT